MDPLIFLDISRGKGIPPLHRKRDRRADPHRPRESRMAEKEAIFRVARYTSNATGLYLTSGIIYMVNRDARRPDGEHRRLKLEKRKKSGYVGVH